MKKWAKEVHPLADSNYPCGLITFIHTDNTTHTFGFATNMMSEDKMAWFDGNAPSINDTKSWIKSVIKDIYNKSLKVTNHIGDYKIA